MARALEPSPSCGRRLLLAWLGTAGAPALRAQTRFPERALTLVVPFGPGGVADLTARAVAEGLARALGQPVVVDNKPGAGSIVAAQAVLGARADGHTLLLMSNANAVSVGLFRKLPYDPQKDFAPLGLIGLFDLGVFAPVGGRFATLADALAFARANPGRLNIATIAPGSTQHLAAKLFETVAGIDAVVVPYKGTPAVLTALRAGEVDLAFEVLGPLLPQVQAGVLKVLALSSGQRHPALPAVPTVVQAGVAGYDVASWNALAVPAATPAAVQQQLQRALREVLAQATVQARLQQAGVRLAPAAAAGPDDTRDLLAREVRRWGEVIRRAKIEPE